MSDLLLPEEIKNQVATSGISDMNLAESIASHFVPFMAEITEQTDKLKGLELGNAEHAEIAKRVNIDLGRIRSRKNDVKKEQKDYYLKVGKFIDSLANFNEGMISLGQEEAQKHSKYFERVEAERKAKLKEERNALMSPYSDFEIPNIELLAEADFEKMLDSYKLAHEARERQAREAEEARIKAEKEEKERQQLIKKREDEIRPLYDFFEVPAMQDLGDLTEEDFQAKLSEAKKAKADHEAEQEKIRIENERLKKEKEAKEKEEKEREELQSIRLAELLPYNSYGPDVDMTTLWNLSVAKYCKILASKRAEKQKEDARIAEENRIAEEARRKKEKEEAERQAELDQIKKEYEKEKQRKADQEAKEKAEAEAKRKAEEALLKAGDQKRILAWIDSMTIEEANLSGISAQGMSLMADITEKFHAFKKWAKNETNKL